MDTDYKSPYSEKTWTFDDERLIRLTVAYATAKAKGEDAFIFDGVKLYTPYAKYLIEYLHNELAK